jgi:hypothetical protein
MASFSQRKGLKPIRETFQQNSMDNDLRIGLWNASFEIYWESVIRDVAYQSHDSYQDNRFFLRSLWSYFYKKPLDEMPTIGQKFMQHVRQDFFNSPWNEVYDLLEAFVICYDDDSVNSRFIDYCNLVLEKELSVYRFVGNQIVEITSESEIETIENALANSLGLVRLHLQQALEHFADRKSPDYRNSIKESISAVESICKQIANNPKATLGQALSEIERQQKIATHGSLIEGFKKLYSYTSDANGIRHALMDEPNLGAEDAKFMLVSCSAFINYLIEKAQKAGIQL